MQTQAEDLFTYSNKQSVNGQPCLVLQTRYFRLLHLKANVLIKIEELVQEVAPSKYYPRTHTVVRADEIVFESKGMHNCNRSIWFDADVKNSSGNIKSAIQSDYSKALFCMPKNDIFRHNLPSVTPHVLMQSKDDCSEGCNLIDSILKHRIGSILASKGFICGWASNIDDLHQDFLRLQNSSKKWMWKPLSKDKVNAIFQEPKEKHAGRDYIPAIDSNAKVLPSIWSAFVKDYDAKHRRLEVFVSIGNNSLTKHDDGVPRITNSPTTFDSSHSEHMSRQLLHGQDGPFLRAYEAFLLESSYGSKSRSSSLSSWSN